MLVPGISGGSIAIMLDIYDELLIRLNNLFSNFRKNFNYLLIVLIGGLIGLFISSYILDFFVNTIYFELIYMFLGVVIIYLINNFKNSVRHNIFLKLFYVFVGFIIGLLITKIPVNMFDENGILTLVLLGIFLAIALILPGISVSYVLLIFNLYDDIILAIKNIDYIYLAKIGLFLFIGIFLVVKFLNYLIIRKKEFMDNVIAGFILSSIWIIIPKLSNFKQIIYATIFILCGIIVRKMIVK